MNVKFGNLAQLYVATVTFLTQGHFHFVSSTALHPLLFIPGDGGSRMFAKLDKPTTTHWYCDKSEDWFLFWVNFSIFLFPWPRNCFLDNIRLAFNETTNTTSNAPGVQIEVDEPGSVEGIRYLDKHEIYDYYAKMIKHFELKGYKAGENLMGISYDFRKCPNENQYILDAVRTLTEKMYWDNNNQSVFIISHSMGGLMIKSFLEHQSQAWKDQFVAGWISIAAPMYGAASSYEMYASGYNFNVPILPSEPLKYAQRSYTSSAWMLPNPDFWDKKDFIIQTPDRNYSVLDYKQFFDDIKYPLGYKVFDMTHRILSFEPPEVNLYCIYGRGVETDSRFIYDASFPEKVPVTTIQEDGDGSVPYKSAIGCGKFSQNKPIVEKSFDKVNHNGLLTDSDVITYVDKIVFTY